MSTNFMNVFEKNSLGYTGSGKYVTDIFYLEWEHQHYNILSKIFKCFKTRYN